MKYISLTFDDGRSDNYYNAKKIMDKYSIKGTVYITTGFVDGSWEGYEVLESPDRALNIVEIQKLYKSGWEIGIHGDKHKTDVVDMGVALSKLQEWKIDNLIWGISIPNSVTDEETVSKIYNSKYGDKIAYIRRGRKCNTKSIDNRVLFGLYTFFKFRWAYFRFNMKNILKISDIDKKNIPSIVVKLNDNPEWIIDFIKRVPDESLVVLMLHSVLTPDNNQYNKDKWSYRDIKFEKLCCGLKQLEEQRQIKVDTLCNFLANK